MKTKRVRMNVKRLQGIAKHIIGKQGKRFIMGKYVTYEGEVKDGYTEPTTRVVDGEATYGKKQWEFAECGTAACIAGWGILLYGHKTPKQVAKLKQPNLYAAKLLGLDMAQADRLFFVTHWPTELRSQFRTGETPLIRAKVAAKRIEYLIKTDGKDDDVLL
jgi:hypothetical protein